MWRNGGRLPRLSWLSWLSALGLVIGLYLVTTAQSNSPIHPDGWDLAFGGDGQAESGCGAWSIGVWAGSIMVQPDGKILLFANCNEQATLLRFLPNGTPDSAFGVNGRTPISPTLGAWTLPARQSDGSLLTVTTINEQAHLVRYQDDGQRDLSFGAMGAAASPVSVEQLLVQADDQIVVHDETGLARFTQQGGLDPTLNGSGAVLLANLLPKPNSAAEQKLLDLVVQPDGKLLLAVYTRWQESAFDQLTQRQIDIVRLTRSGMIDQDFATAGSYTVMVTTRDYMYDCRQYVALQPDGQILATNPDTRQLIRLQPTGVLDAAFQTPQVCFNHLVIDQAGFIIGHAGYWTNRLLPTGGLDTSWGNNGQLDWNGGFAGLDLHPDGSLIVSTILDNTGFKLMRNVKTQTYPPPTTPTPTPTPLPTALPPEQRPLGLIYAVLDNNLGEASFELFNKIEAGVDAGMDVRLLLDGPEVNDAYVYQMQEDHNPFCPSAGNPTCSGRYSDGSNRWKFFTEDTAQPTSLYQFVLDSLHAHPQAPQVSLALVGHGSGWGANVLPAQPSFWKKQNDTLGGMLWDDHTGGSAGTRSLSTLALADALRGVQAETGRRIDLLYLDGCSMGMTEIAYELAGTADYLLASPNTDWATFSYDRLLPEVKNGVDARSLGLRWLARETALLRSQPGHPFTLALTDLQQMGHFSTTVSTLGDALQAALPTQRAQIVQAFTASDRYDSNYDAKLDFTDNYLDLKAFAQQLQQVGLTNSLVISAAQQMETVLASAVISTAYASGTPWVAEDQTWAWQTMGGLSIYAPLGQDEAKRRIYYNSNNLTWAADTTWDEFLGAFWANSGDGITVATTDGEMPVCQATTDGCTGLANPQPAAEQPVQTLYLTFVKR